MRDNVAKGSISRRDMLKLAGATAVGSIVSIIPEKVVAQAKRATSRRLAISFSPV